MTMYEVDDELAAVIERLAQKKPFENLSFQDALRRVLHECLPKATGVVSPGAAAGVDIPELARQVTIENALGVARTVIKKAPTPSAIEWAATVPELKKRRHLTTWKAITDSLDIDTLGDSARRKLAAWVKTNRPNWPPVPEIEGD